MSIYSLLIFFLSQRLGLYLRGLTCLGLTAETLTAEQIHLLSNGFLMDWNQATVVYPKIDNFYRYDPFNVLSQES